MTMPLTEKLEILMNNSDLLNIEKTSLLSRTENINGQGDIFDFILANLSNGDKSKLSRLQIPRKIMSESERFDLITRGLLIREELLKFLEKKNIHEFTLEKAKAKASKILMLGLWKLESIHSVDELTQQLFERFSTELEIENVVEERYKGNLVKATSDLLRQLVIINGELTSQFTEGLYKGLLKSNLYNEVITLNLSYKIFEYLKSKKELSYKSIAQSEKLYNTPDHLVPIISPDIKEGDSLKVTEMKRRQSTNSFIQSENSFIQGENLPQFEQVEHHYESLLNLVRSKINSSPIEDLGNVVNNFSLEEKRLVSELINGAWAKTFNKIK